MIVAAEASSALYAERLLQHWRKSDRKVQAFGVGTVAMEELGFERLGKSEEMAVVGAAEVIEKYSLLKSVFESLVQEAEKRRPDFALVLDYPDFNLKLAKKLQALNIPVVYYVSPQIWAWRSGRIHQIKKLCREVLLLFNFERPFYQKHNVPHVFVGHPLLDELKPQFFEASHVELQRSRRGIQKGEVVLGLMPGSRKSELKLNFPTQLETARRLYKKNKNLKVMVLIAPTVTQDELQQYMGDVRFPVIFVKDEPASMILLTDVILATSGTATLFVALLEKPMVMMYKLKLSTYLLAKVLVRGVKMFGLPNLIAEKLIVLERIQNQATPEILEKDLQQLIDDQQLRQQMISELKLLKEKLGDRGATERVAAALEKYFKK